MANISLIIHHSVSNNYSLATTSDEEVMVVYRITLFLSVVGFEQNLKDKEEARCFTPS